MIANQLTDQRRNDLLVGASEMPYVDPHSEYGRHDFLEEFKETFVVRARFQGSYANDPDRLNILTFADQMAEARGVEEWTFMAETYPEIPLVAEKLTKYDNEDIPVRAYFLGKALKRLMELSGAPEVMISDLELLIGGFAPKGAEKYAKAQSALIENPGLAISKISELCGLNRHTIYALLKKGALVRAE